jgi:hypothetical protein
MRSRATGDEFIQTPLLYPVTHKDYNQSQFITHEWERLKVWLEGAKLLTIFGYGAPVTDVEAVDLMGSAWGDSRQRNMEQIEIIDIQPKEVVADRWQRFIHTHHYECFNSYFQSSLAFFPRRTGERFMHQFVPVTPGEVFQEPNPVPQRFDTLEAFWEWHRPLLDAENRKLMTKQWAKREQQIRAVIDTTSGLYGDLQGIAGRSLKEIDALEKQMLLTDET